MQSIDKYSPSCSTAIFDGDDVDDDVNTGDVSSDGLSRL